MTDQIKRISYPSAVRGSSLIEVLMAIVIVGFGLLALAALQGRATTAELESYQRGQALVLLEDMASRIKNNPANAASYVTTASPGHLGTGNANYPDACADISPPPSRAEVDKCEWSNMLKGGSETGASGNKVGAMINGRGCVEASGTVRMYTVTVVWQGMSETVAPGSSCGQNAYDSEASRRAVTTTIQIPDLAAL